MHERVEQTEEQAAARPAAPPSLLAAPSVGAVTALQRTIGNRATVAALSSARAAGPGRPLQRELLDADEMVDRLSDIPFFAEKLAGRLDPVAEANKVGHGAAGAAAVTELRRHTVGSHVREALAAYEANLGSTSLIIDQAMMVAGVVNAAGRAVAQAINDPGLAPMFAREIMRVYRDEIAQKLLSGPGASARERGKVGGVVEIASVLAGENPVALYLGRRLRLEDAVWRLGVGAHKAGVDIAVFTKLLRGQWEMDVGTRSRAHVKAAEMATDQGAGGSFLLQKLSGGVEAAFFEGSLVFGDDDMPEWDDGALKLKGEAKARLDDLLQAITLWDPANVEDVDDDEEPGPERRPGLDERIGTRSVRARGEHAERMEPSLKAISAIGKGKRKAPKLQHAEETVPPPGSGGAQLSENQYGLIKEVQRHDAKLLDGAREILVDYMGERYGFDRGEALAVIARCESWFRHIPITISIKAEAFFSTGPEPAWGTAYRPTAVLSKGLGEEDYGGKADGTEFAHAKGGGERGENYLHWRRDKDAEETRLRGLTDQESANFGAANINFEHTQGHEGGLFYGETHLVLKDSVRARTLFNFDTVRMLHSDLLPAMADIIRQPDTPNYAGVAPKYPKSEFIDAIVANAMKTGDMYYIDNLQFEAEIFGDLDLKTDVAAISTPKGEFKTTGQMRNFGETSTIPDRVRRNLKRFASSNGIKVIEWDAAKWPAGRKPEGAAFSSKAEFAAKVRDALESDED